MLEGQQRFHESLYTEWLSHVDLDNGSDLVGTILLGPNGVG